MVLALWLQMLCLFPWQCCGAGGILSSIFSAWLQIFYPEMMLGCTDGPPAPVHSVAPSPISCAGSCGRAKISIHLCPLTVGRGLQPLGSARHGVRAGGAAGLPVARDAEALCSQLVLRGNKACCLSLCWRVAAVNGAPGPRSIL